MIARLILGQWPARPVTHLIEKPGDRKTLCGADKYDGSWVWLRWVEHHPVLPCPDCELAFNKGRWFA